MAINKNFVIKNGVEVNTSLIVGDATLNKVGVGTTVPGYTLHVGGSRGGIGATDLTVTGIATVGTSGSTSAALSVVGVSSFQGDIHLLGSAGVSTISFDASLDKLNFADNARATFGADDDLQIFHDGSNSIIRETGTGNLVIEGTGETLASFIDDGAVELYHDNTKRLETTGFGVTIFDTLHSKQVNVSGASTFTGITTFNGADVFVDNSLFVGGVNINGGSGGALGIDLRTRNINASGIATITGQLGIGSIAAGAGLTVFGDVDITGLTTTNTLQVGNLGLDVTGVSTFKNDLNVGLTTFFVDKSTGRIGIGTNVPSAALEVGATAGTGIGVSIFENGNAAFSGIVTIGGNLNVTGDITYDEVNGRNLNISGFSTFANDLAVGVSTLFADVSAGRIGIGTAVPASTLDVDGALTVNSAKVEDLTDNRIVIAGSSGELEDDSNLTFDGVKLNVGSGVTIFPHGGAAFAGIVTVGGDLNVQGDITYDEIGGRNLNITGISTQAGQVNFGTSGVGATVFANGNVAISGVTTSNGGVVVGTAVTIQSNGAAAFVGVVTAGTALVTGSAKVEDLTDNRVVLAGTGGELEDSANLTFDGAGLVVTGNANVSGVSTFSDDLIVGVSTLVVEVTNGRIGIGTAVPSRKVEIFDTAATVLQLNSTSSDGTSLRIQNSGTDKTFVGLAGDFITGQANNVTDSAIRASGALLFASGGGTERARITSGGDVGIGTTVPETPRGNRGLEVAGTTGAEFVATRFDDNLVDGDFIGGFVFKNLDAGGSPNHFAGMYAKANGTAGSMDLHFTGDRAQYESDTSDLTIRSSNVGIGTTLPQDTLDVANAVPQIRLTDLSDGSFGQIRANGGNLIVRADEGNTIADSLFLVEIDGTEKLRITDNNDVVLGGGATVGSSSGIVTFIGDGSQLTGVISGIDITEDAGLVGAAITNLKFTGSGISTVTTDTSVGIATINITGGGGATEVDTSVSTTTATGVGSFAVATHRSASIIAQIDQGGSYQVGRYLMIHDGTTATVIEESAIATGDMLGSFSADINNSNAELKVTMNSSGIATVTTKIDSVTV